MRPLTIPLLVAVLLAVGCGGDPGSGGSDPTPTPAAVLPTDPAEITRAWADAVRTDDLDRATRLFAVPAVVANATPPARLTSAGQIRAFNASFPCGANFVGARELSGGRVLTTYTLTERRNAPAPCGSGVGARAGVLFTIRDGRITRWIRADPDATPPGPDRTPQPQV